MLAVGRTAQENSMLQEDIDFLKEIHALLKTNNYHDKEQAITMLGDEIAHLEKTARHSVQADGYTACLECGLMIPVG